MATFSEKDYRT